MLRKDHNLFSSSSMSRHSLHLHFFSVQKNCNGHFYVQAPSWCKANSQERAKVPYLILSNIIPAKNLTNLKCEVQSPAKMMVTLSRRSLCCTWPFVNQGPGGKRVWSSFYFCFCSTDATEHKSHCPFLEQGTGECLWHKKFKNLN
jgi:hypothetical protein